VTKERYKELSNNSIHRELPVSGGQLTDEEFNEGYHYCDDWDGLFIGPKDPEWDCCTCHPLKNGWVRG